MMPRFDNYYGDYTQLSFYYKEEGTMVAFYGYEEDALGKVYSQVIAINLAKFAMNIRPKDKEEEEMLFEMFVNQFILVWLHEWFHLVGLSEKGLDEIKVLRFPVA